MGAGLDGSSEGGPETRAGGEGGVLSFTRAARFSPWLPELEVPRGSCVELALGDEGGQVRGLSCPHSEHHPGSTLAEDPTPAPVTAASDAASPQARPAAVTLPTHTPPESHQQLLAVKFCLPNPHLLLEHSTESLQKECSEPLGFPCPPPLDTRKEWGSRDPGLGPSLLLSDSMTWMYQFNFAGPQSPYL